MFVSCMPSANTEAVMHLSVRRDRGEFRFSPLYPPNNLHTPLKTTRCARGREAAAAAGVWIRKILGKGFLFECGLNFCLFLHCRLLLRFPSPPQREKPHAVAVSRG